MLVEMSETTGSRLPYPLLAEERPFTVDDLDTMPDDGRRYELIDGTLVVSAAPGWLHQRAVMNLALLLAQACPPGFEVLPAPFAVQFNERTQLQPDIVVTESRHFSARGLYVPPLLAVEVLSESTQMYDRYTKSQVFARAGTPSFWVVEPLARPAEARLEAWELSSRRKYRRVAAVVGDELYETVNPYPVAVRPADLARER
jgi:Uma2 family endonuclease